MPTRSELIPNARKNLKTLPPDILLARAARAIHRTYHHRNETHFLIAFSLAVSENMIEKYKDNYKNFDSHDKKTLLMLEAAAIYFFKKPNNSMSIDKASEIINELVAAIDDLNN